MGGGVRPGQTGEAKATLATCSWVDCCWVQNRSNHTGKEVEKRGGRSGQAFPRPC